MMTQNSKSARSPGLNSKSKSSKLRSLSLLYPAANARVRQINEANQAMQRRAELAREANLPPGEPLSGDKKPAKAGPMAEALSQAAVPSSCTGREAFAAADDGDLKAEMAEIEFELRQLEALTRGNPSLALQLDALIRPLIEEIGGDCSAGSLKSSSGTSGSGAQRLTCFPFPPLLHSAGCSVFDMPQPAGLQAVALLIGALLLSEGVVSVHLIPRHGRPH